MDHILGWQVKAGSDFGVSWVAAAEGSTSFKQLGAGSFVDGACPITFSTRVSWSREKWLTINAST